MKTRSIHVWYTPPGSMHEQCDDSFYGAYSERYEDLPDNLKNHPAGWIAFRIGELRDMAKQKAIVFRQLVKDRREAPPDSLCMCEDHGGTYPAWNDAAACTVWDVSIRAIEAARADSTAKTKRARVNRRNAKLGGAPLKDNPELIERAVAGVRARLRVNSRLGMKRACELECREKGLSIKWEALRKHVKKPKGAK